MIKKTIRTSVLRLAFAIFASVTLINQSAAVTVSAVPSALSPSMALTESVKNEIDRRLTEIATNKDGLKQSTVLANNIRAKLISAIDKVKQGLDKQNSSLAVTTELEKLKSIATEIDASFDDYKATNQVSKLVINVEAQVKLVKNLTAVADSIQATISAVKANGATHVNAGVGGLIPIAAVQENLDQLKYNLMGNNSIIESVTSMLAVTIEKNMDSLSTIPTAAFNQLTLSQTTLSNAATGLSQLSNLTTGGRVGLSICGVGSNCDGQKNEGEIAICGVGSNCKDSTNNAGVTTCGVGSNCTNSVNNGLFLNCGVGSNCKDSTNNGKVTTCGVGSNCSNSKNSGDLAICGVGSNCSNTTNDGAYFMCGVGSNCKGSQVGGVIFVCGVGSNCSNIVVNNCKVNSDGEPI